VFEINSIVFYQGFNRDTVFEDIETNRADRIYICKDCALFEKSSQAVFLGETFFETEVFIRTAWDIESSRRLCVAIRRL
jgi:hypothetical protein